MPSIFPSWEPSGRLASCFLQLISTLLLVSPMALLSQHCSAGHVRGPLPLFLPIGDAAQSWQ